MAGKRLVRGGGGRVLRLGTYGNALYHGVRFANNVYKAWNKRSNGQRSNGGSKGARTHFTTAQYDTSRVYRRKRMPRRKRKRWVRFKRKVDAVQFSGLGMQSVVFNQADYIAAADGVQGVGSVCMYGLLGSSGTASSGVFLGQRDLVNIVNTGNFNSGDKLMFRSACLDVTCKNEPAEGSEATQAEVDVYEYVWRKTRNVVAGARSAKGMLEEGLVNAGPIGTAFQLTMATRGLTPFQIPEAMSYLKILKKQKFFVPAGGTFTYQIRDPKNFWFDCGDATNGATPVENCRGRTRGLIFFVKGVPTLTTAASALNLVIGCTRTYEYKKEDVTSVNDGFIVPA